MGVGGDGWRMSLVRIVGEGSNGREELVDSESFCCCC